MHTYSAEPVAGPAQIVAVGQLSCDTIIALERPLVARDHNSGRTQSLVGGTGAIVAHNIAALGGHAVFSGQVGGGIEHHNAIRALREAGVVIGPLMRTPHGLRVVIVVEPDGERTMFATGDRPEWSELNLSAQSGDIVFFEGWHLLGETPDPAFLELIRRTSATGATVALDVCTTNNTGFGHRELLADLPIDILLANSTEAEVLGLLAAPTSPTVIVHRGCEPTVLITAGVRQEFPVDVITPVDTTGAGDTFAAGFLLALLRSRDVPAAVREGLLAARTVVRVLGPLLPVVTANQTQSIAV